MTTYELETPRTTVTTADLLRRAADILEEFDWRQGDAGSREEGSLCAVGAIRAARDDYGLLWEDPAHIKALLVHGAPEAVCGIIPLAIWNDQPGRTKAEVVAELRRLAT